MKPAGPDLAGLSTNLAVLTCPVTSAVRLTAGILSANADKNVSYDVLGSSGNRPLPGCLQTLRYIL
jgi:hypothetical protein